MKNVKHLIILLAISFSQVAFAQNGTVRGTVIEESIGEPMYGVTLILKGTSYGAISDFDGKFSISAPAGTYELQASYIGFQTIVISDVIVKGGEVTVIEKILMAEESEMLEEVVVTAEAIRTTETALLTVKRKSVNLIDGISAESFRRIGDSDAGQAAKRVTGVSVEGGKYVYVRGLGDRYTKTTLNGMDIPGLDPDRNSIQIDVFPTNLIDNMIILKSFTPDLPADFTGGIVNIDTKDFPDTKILDFSLSMEFNPSMHFNSDYITYAGGDTDFLGFDNGTRQLPTGYDLANAPNPFNSTDPEVAQFLGEFSPVMGIQPETSFMDYSFGLTYGDQVEFDNGHSLGFLFSGNYRNSTILYDDAFFGEFQNDRNIDEIEFQRAATFDGLLTENEVLLGGLAGLAYKTYSSKFRLTLMRLQNGLSRSGQFDLVDDDSAIGKSGYDGIAENMEYNERGVTNLFLNGEHHINEDKWVIDWRAASTWSTQDDPDIRQTPFTLVGDRFVFAPGAAGNPTRLWRALEEVNTQGKVDVTHELQLFQRDAKIKFGGGYTYKERDYNIVSFNVNFFQGQQLDWSGSGLEVWTPQTTYPDGPVYLVSGFREPNPNQYNSNVNSSAAYISGEFSPLEKLKAIVGVRMENYVQRHTGRDQLQTRVLENDIVLDDMNLFPSVNFIYAVQEKQNLRASFSQTIARPSFKELSFAQILDPVSNRIFNGGLFPIDDWNGDLKSTNINNFDLRWERYFERGQNFSFSAFYKTFENPIELVRIPQAQTNPEFQPRNVGNGTLFGIEFEFKKALDIISDKWSIYGNFTLVESAIDMSETELRNRRNNARNGEEINEARNMQGQAPWIINAGLAYDNYELGIDAGLFYNVKGKTLAVVGGGIDPDVFVQPFNSLNFNINKVFGAEDQWTVNFSVNNILNDTFEQFYERSFSSADERGLQASPAIFQRWSPGISFGFGLKYSL
jgi:outer membrane receptor protein involved in Fe transport